MRPRDFDFQFRELVVPRLENAAGRFAPAVARGDLCFGETVDMLMRIALGLGAADVFDLGDLEDHLTGLLADLTYPLWEASLAGDG